MARWSFPKFFSVEQLVALQNKNTLTLHTLASAQSVMEDYRRFGECKGGVREILFIV